MEGLQTVSPPLFPKPNNEWNNNKTYNIKSSTSCALATGCIQGTYKGEENDDEEDERQEKYKIDT